MTTGWTMETLQSWISKQVSFRIEFSFFSFSLSEHLKLVHMAKRQFRHQPKQLGIITSNKCLNVLMAL
jgi:hypothetical protein